MYQGDYRLGKTIYFTFTSRRFTTGVPYALAGSPALSIIDNDSSTPITAGITLVASLGSIVGLNSVKIIASSGNGFATAHDYSVYISAGTVDSVSVVGETIGSFSIENRSALMPTTADRTLDISSTGEAGVDWANVGSPTTTVNLSGTSTLALEPTTAGRKLDVTTTGEAGIDWSNIGAPTTTVALTGTTISTSQIVASVSGAVGSVTGAVGSVTGNVGGNVTGSVASVTAPVTVGTNNDKTGYSLNSPQTINITGNITGNLSGSVGSVTGAVGSVTSPVTVGTNNDKTGYALTSAYDPAKTAAQAGDAMVVDTGGIDSTSFAAGAIDAAALAASASEEIADGILNRNIAGGSNGSRNVTSALRASRNKVEIDAFGNMTVYEEDDIATAWTAVATRDAAADPIVSIDPS